MITHQDYSVADPDALETPAMLLFQDKMEHNIRSVCEMVGGGENLMVHVKTHKSVAVARKQVELGIAGFKCATLKELECDLTAACPDAWIATIVSSPVHLEVLASVAEGREQSLRVMLDLDTGMHRTGIGFGPDAANLYRQIDAHPMLEPAGFHLYDGHNNFSDLEQREAAAQRNIESLQEFRQQIESAGVPVPYVVAGSSYSFAYYARTQGMHGSPGTFVYWDTGFGAAMPDMPFRCAALILTQVVDRYPDAGTITTDLGYKAICGDIPLEERASLLGHDGAQLILQDEEHGAFHIVGELPQVGDYLLAVPGHACPTTIRYPGSHVIDSAGNVTDYYLHTARDRL